MRQKARCGEQGGADPGQFEGGVARGVDGAGDGALRKSAWFVPTAMDWD